MNLEDEDDFDHYFKATGRLSAENSRLRREIMGRDIIIIILCITAIAILIFK